MANSHWHETRRKLVKILEEDGATAIHQYQIRMMHLQFVNELENQLKTIELMLTKMNHMSEFHKRVVQARIAQVKRDLNLNQ